jgi:DNA-directed RNA polymerase specialized sigma24 family protein
LRHDNDRPPSAPPSRPADAGVVYRRFKGFVAIALRRCDIRWSDIPDLVQEVFIVVHKRYHAFDPRKGTIKAWLYGIAYNVAQNHRRLFYNRVFLLIGDALGRLPAASDPERDATTCQEVQAIDDAAADVSDEDLDLVLKAGLDEKGTGCRWGPRSAQIW